MVESIQNRDTDILIADSRWKDLYRIGCFSFIILVALLIFAIIAFLIWPYKPGFTSTQDILTTLQSDRLGGLMSLDLPFLMIELITILPLLALYVVLKRVNESYALIALVLGLIAVVSFILARPLFELVLISERYATAISVAERSQYLAAGEALLAFFDGTAWMVGTVFVAVSYLISSLLMLRSNIFSKTTAYIGVIFSVAGFGFFIPVVGPLLLLMATFGGVIWYILLARTYFRLGWGK